MRRLITGWLASLGLTDRQEMCAHHSYVHICILYFLSRIFHSSSKTVFWICILRYCQEMCTHHSYVHICMLYFLSSIFHSSSRSVFQFFYFEILPRNMRPPSKHAHLYFALLYPICEHTNQIGVKGERVFSIGGVGFTIFDPNY